MTYEEYLRDRQQIVDRCAKIVDAAIAERERATHALYELFRHGERRHPLQIPSAISSVGCEFKSD